MKISILFFFSQPIKLLFVPFFWADRYKFYGDAENIANELPYFVSQLTNNEMKFRIPKKSQVGSADHTTNEMANVKNRTLLKQISEFYKTDYEMFGLEYPDPRI